MTGFGVPTSRRVQSVYPDNGSTLPSLTVLVPCLNETRATLGALLRRLDPAQYRGDFHVKILIERGRAHDNREARAAAEDFDPRWVTIEQVTSCQPKARAVNAGIDTSGTSLIALFDADTRIESSTLSALVRTLVAHDLDMVEAFDLCTDNHPRAQAGNAQALAFQASMQWLSQQIGRRFMGSSAIVTTTALFEALGRYPTHGVEEGYRWSMNARQHPVRHALVPVLVPGDVPASVPLMLHQRTRWITGQLVGSIEALGGGKNKNRRLALIGAASLLLQGAWSLSLLLVPFSCGACLFFVAFGVFEVGRLTTARLSGVEKRLGVGSSPLLGVALELAEGFMVPRALARILRRRAHYWDHVRDGPSGTS